MVPPLSGTWTRCFLACSTAFEMATGTSAALPLPIPTHPCPSPTTTSAQKLKRFPPFTTLATRLMNTTLSFRLSSSGLTRTLVPPFSLPTIRGPQINLELQAPFTRRIRKRLDPAVIHPATSIKDDCAGPWRLLARSAINFPTALAASMLLVDFSDFRKDLSSDEAAASVVPLISSMIWA